MKKRTAFPTTVDIALTGKCNLRCKHCNTSDTWALDEELDLGGWVKVLDQLKEEKIFNLTIFGGEPFAYPEINGFLKLLNDYPMRVNILTNGTLIDANTVKYLKKMRFLENLQVSIDGSCPEVHDWQRGEGSFDKAINGVKLLIDENVPVKIKAIVNKHSCGDIENMVKLALSLGLRGMDFGDAVECGRAAVFASDMSFQGEVHRLMMETVFRMKEKYPDFAIGGTLGQKKEMLEDFYAHGPGQGKRGTFSTCPAGQSTLSIRSDGKVVPCSAFWTFICGDIRKDSLRDIWDNSERLNTIRAIADEKLTDHDPECEKCDYLTYCNGGCRACAYYSSGENIRGFDRSNCLVFSDIYGYRYQPGVKAVT
jgi:SynChlorMet cassette radical SAM/SPASM protein ScmE